MSNILNEDFENIFLNTCSLNKIKNSRILITGINGFLASYLIKFLIFLNKKKKFNIEIIGTTRNRKKAEKFYSEFFQDKKFKIYETDLLNKLKIKEDLNYVIHMASLASPKYYKSNPVDVLQPNVIGTLNLMNLVKKSKIKNFLFISTSGVYGFMENKKRPNNESTFGTLDNTLPESIYLESKRMAETICFAYKNQYKIPATIARPSICYGPGIDLKDGRSFADFISNILSNKNITLYSKGKVMRNFCYISDVISGILLVLINGKNGECYNLASDKEISIRALANFLVKKVFPEKKLKVTFTEMKHKLLRTEFNRTQVDCSKIKKIGWLERVNLKNGFKRTVKWYSNG